MGPGVLFFPIAGFNIGQDCLVNDFGRLVWVVLSPVAAHTPKVAKA